MRSFGAAALFTLAIITECFGAHSDRSRSRSGPVRRVPVAANVKRDVDFDCPEEFGYYPHPTDCTLYYVCVFGGALLESCTGGLMYSHELQTCDWPRNVGCDGTSAVGGEELERINERDPPPPPPPRRAPPPPPPRAQPNPIVTSRGQPKFNRQEYEKQQQLYAEVDDLPPIEEIESDRQQRVYRGQPPTIGQVQKDRDGYGGQSISSGRTLNSNIIPASLPQNGVKIGSFSFGSQVDDRRTVTPAPQSYSLEPTESVTPVSYSANPRPKMLYNGSQNYSPDQYDPFYAVYDEDGELYKDTDYVQQYNTASLRPAVQQTYRGTPPPAPARRPVETYTQRPAPVDYDDELIQPQINNQNQYQTPVRQSTRGEGNELGYDHNPSSVRTTLYEATTYSTTPPTTTSTSTTTTTQRPTTAPYTEAMTPSRYTPRSSTDESPIPESSSKPSDETTSSIPSTPLPSINISSLAKPFERTDNLHRLQDTISTTETLPTAYRRSSEVTNNNNVEVVRSKSNGNNNKKIVSLTSGFSIRRSNNSNNPYTLTVLSRPLEDFDNARKPNSRGSIRHTQSKTYYYDTSSSSRDTSEEPAPAYGSTSKYDSSSDRSMRRNDFGPDVSENDDDIPVYVRPTNRARTINPKIRTTTPPTTSPKYYIKSVNTRPTPFSSANNQEIVDSTENAINTDVLIDTGLQNARINEISSVAPNDTLDEQPPTREYDRSQYTWNEPTVSPYKTLDNLRNAFKTADTTNTRSYTTSTTSTTASTTTTRRPSRNRNTKKEKISRSKPSYYSYRLEDEVVPDQTTEIFNGKVKTVIKAFLNNFVSSSEPQLVEEFTSTTTTPKTTTPSQRDEEKIVNIGYQKKPLKYVDEKPLRTNFKHLKIITEPSISRYVDPTYESVGESEKESQAKDFSSTTTTMTTMSSSPFTYANLPTSSMPSSPTQSTTNDFRSETSSRDSYQSKFSSLITSKPIHESSRKFQNIIKDVQSTESSKQTVETPDEVIKPTLSITDDFKTTTEAENHIINKVESEIASTTSTTKSTTTLKFEPTTSTTKSISFPTRASRVNPAIKLAATNPGGGRRSYQSSSKCSSDNSLQANPKCNEIKYQRYKYSPASSLSSLKLSHITY